MSPVTFIHQARREGIHSAWDSFKRRRHLPILAYLLLTAAIAFSLGAVRHEGIARRDAIVASGQTAVRLGCTADNDTRHVLRFLIQQGKPSLKGYHDRGLLTDREYRIAVHQNALAVKLLHPRDCRKASVKFHG